MAEVSLTVDNTSGKLPIDFAEVTVTRRAYRSGESEFFINKTACRLRDIYELFLDTGVGRGAYSIVSQGEIDAMLSAEIENVSYENAQNDKEVADADVFQWPPGREARSMQA